MNNKPQNKSKHKPFNKELVGTGKHAGKQQRPPRKPVDTPKPSIYTNPKSTPVVSDEIDSPVQGPEGPERIQKVLARGGVGSRREIERWITEARIKLNGNVAKLGDCLKPGDLVYLNGRPVMWEKYAQQPTRVIVYHKPAGEIVTRKDPQGRPLVFNKLPKLQVGRWISVGRLDINTSGLLLLTNNGELANRLMHPTSIIDREYAVRILGDVSDETLALLKQGIELEDGLAQFTDVKLYGGEGANKWYHVTVCEGRNRLVRRLWEAVNVTVSRLIRVRYGPAFLPKGLKVKEHYEMLPKELELLLAYVDLPSEKKFAAPERL